MSELGLVAPLGALVVVAFLYLRRLYEGPATAAWGAAWVSLYGAGTIAALDAPPLGLHLLGPVLGSLFPALLLTGALSLGRVRWVLWPVGIGLGIGITRAALAVGGRVEWSLALAIPLELPLSLGAAAVAWRAARERPRSFPEQLMGPALVLLALVNAADPLARLVDLSMIPLVLCWLTASLSVALLQVMTFIERIREREQRLLAEHELLHQVARMATRAPHETQAALDEVISAVASLVNPDGFGIWRLEPSGTHLRCAARMRRIDEIPNALSHLPVGDPLIERALANPEPVTIVDLRRAEEIVRRRAMEWGVSETAVAPLRATGRTYGVLFAALVPGRHFEMSDRRLLASLAQEITLVLSHAEALEQRTRHAEALEDERRTLRALLEAVPAGILLADRQGRITMLSHLAAEHYGLAEPASWIRRTIRDAFLHIERRLDHDDARQLSRYFAPGRFSDRVFELRFSEPRERILEIALHELRPEDPESARQLWVSRDITEKRLSEAEETEPPPEPGFRRPSESLAVRGGSRDEDRER